MKLSKKLLSLILIIVLSFESVPCKLLKSKIISYAADDAIATITKDSETEFLDAVKKLNSNGGTIYINTPIINISTTSTIKLSGTKAGGIVGMKLSDGTYPRLDFVKARNAGSTARGISITGTNQFIKYLIIENSGDNGIFVSGSKNTIDHVIARYNNDSGIQLSNVTHIEIVMLTILVLMLMDLLQN